MAPNLSRRTFAIENNGQLTLIIVPLVLLILASAVVGLRFQARHLRKSRAFTDDYLVLLALILSWAGYAANLVMVLDGGGALPQRTLERTDLVIWFKALIANYVLWVASVAATQLSILWFYTRLFGIKTAFRTSCYVAMGIVGAWWLSATIAEVTACIPLFKAYTPMQPGTCINEDAMCSAVGLIHVVFDFAVLTLPIPIIWKLQMARSSRIVVIIILAFGAFAGICSLLRIACLVKLGDGPSTDKTAAWQALAYQVIEAPLGIICICIPSLLPVWEKVSRSRLGSIAKRLFTSQSSRSRHSTKTWNSAQDHKGPAGGFETINSSKTVTTIGTEEQDYMKRIPSDELPLRDLQSTNVEQRPLKIKKTQDWEIAR